VKMKLLKCGTIMLYSSVDGTGDKHVFYDRIKVVEWQSVNEEFMQKQSNPYNHGQRTLNGE